MVWICSGNISINLTNDRMKGISLIGTAYDFSVDHSAVEKEDIFEIYLFMAI